MLSTLVSNIIARDGSGTSEPVRVNSPFDVALAAVHEEPESTLKNIPGGELFEKPLTESVVSATRLMKPVLPAMVSTFSRRPSASQ